MSARFFLGIDGGGSKTEFVCIDERAAIVATHRTGPTYHLQVGLHGVERALVEGLAAVCAQVGIEPSMLGFTFVGLPAFGEDSTIDPALAVLCARLFGQHHRLANDMVCGWAGSLDCADGINLVAGTGSIGYGRRGDGEARVGGWGEMFSDEASAYWIAVQGLNAFTRMSDGRLPRGPLHATLVDAFALDHDLDLCARTLGKEGMDRDAVAALAPLISAAASAGDAAASAILMTAAEELALMAATLRTALGYERGERASLSWSGSVLSNVHALRASFEQRLDTGEYHIVAPSHSPALGAARYAARLGGLALA